MKTKSNGFTIVELTVIVTVIAILAGLVIFSVGNWRQRTAENEVKSDLTNLASAMENARNFNNGYPPANSLPPGFTASQNVDVQLKSSSASSYCAEGKSKVVTSVVYRIGSGASSPVSGAC